MQRGFNLFIYKLPDVALIFHELIIKFPGYLEAKGNLSGMSFSFVRASQ